MVGIENPRTSVRELSIFHFLGKRGNNLALVLEVIGRTANVDSHRLMQQTVEQRGSQNSIGKDVTPFAIGPVGSQDNAAMLIAVKDQLEQEMGRTFVKGEVADFRW